MDGDGYPDGIDREDIPLGARIVAVCDAYDAMTSARPYAEAMPSKDALAELRRCAGTQFDPEVVEAFAGARRPARPETRRRLASIVPVRGLRTLSILIALTALAVALLAGVPARAGDTFKDCGDVAEEGAGVYNVKAKHVGCAKARRKADLFFETRDETLGNFICDEVQKGDELFQGRCVRRAPLFGALQLRLGALSGGAWGRPLLTQRQWRSVT